ncbi:MAG: ATP-binding cassette domain-containing protein [Acutalibacteraceae bacterium]|nr:ATP-binding cassette domain-containing protein [Acutalibacteraceae bacterium]
MENYIFKNVSFSYPEQEQKALEDISFEVVQGEFLVLCGPSGCGKSTLLRHLKACLKPHGALSGEILFEGTALDNIDDRTQAQKIGFVMQSPENQVVTDKVWHELAFGLESLGYDTPTIRRRVAEVASFFGIEKWFYKDVGELSGGQKQLLSLASVMAMQPSVLVLDEPTAQLDPIAATDFLALLGRINRELGTTVILTEHRLEEAFVYATRVVVMEKGKIICDDIPEQVGLTLKEKESSMFLAMPTAMRVWARVETALSCPVTVRDGSDFLNLRNKEKPLRELYKKDEIAQSDDIALSADNIWFRYEKDSPDVLKGFSVELKKGDFYALLGGNGAGKSTTLKVISDILTAYRGEVQVNGRLAHLPQNPQTLFVKRTVREDLYEVFKGNKMSKEEKDEQVARVVKLCELSSFIDRHPYDISGGEQQRTALAKVLLTSPDVLLLDEPTKGFDAEFKISFANILKKLLRQGVTILMVSHDVAFCAEYAHHCGMFFDGNIVAEGTPREFFSGNSFYTTPANRMARHLIPNAVTVEDITYCCGAEITEKVLVDEEITPLPQISKRSVSFKPKPLPLWRKLTACASMLVALAVFIYATSVTDLSSIVTSSGISEQGFEQLKLYIVLFVALSVFILSIGRRSEPPIIVQTDKKQRNLNKRTIVASALILLFIPLTIFTGVFYLDNDYYSIVALLVLLECMLPFVLVFEGRKPKARELVTIAVLCAVGVAGRSLFFMLPQFKPVLALTIITGVALGGETGFLVGAVTMLTSNMLFSQGPWTPWQMFAMGIIGFLAGVLFKKGWLRRTRISLAVFGALSAIVIYGVIMNTSSALMFSPQSINFKMLLAYYVTGLPMDLTHGFSTALFLLLVAEPMLEKLDRIKVKYGLIE